MDRCQKCGSGAYTASGCVICGAPPWPVVGQRPDDGPSVPDAEPWWDGPGGDPRFRRLKRLWAARDRFLDWEGTEEPMSDKEKVYCCTACEVTFASREALAGHGNSAKHKAKVAAAQGPPAPAAEVSEAALWADPPATPGGNGLCCPTCSTALPAAVRVVAESFTAEGVDDELATKLAVKAFGLLRVPA